jgi:hypothetical protein
MLSCLLIIVLLSFFLVHIFSSSWRQIKLLQLILIHHHWEITKNINHLLPKTFIVDFSIKFLEKMPLCEKIPHGKSYLNILNGT